MNIDKQYRELFNDMRDIKIESENLVSIVPSNISKSQKQTGKAFSDKWNQYTYGTPEFRKMVEHQKNWYLELYGFDSESSLADYLQNCSVILDAGAGTCYKAAWFAELSPTSIVVAADISDSLYHAAKHYSGLKNILFLQCDIASLSYFNDNLFDYVSCDQAIHHTYEPYKTFQELVRVTGINRELSVYVYRKKSLPRELLDDHFRTLSKTLDHDKRMELAEQITKLGKLLSSVNRKLDFPKIPLLGIDGGEMTVQKFIYWNFMKCYWNDEVGFHNSLMTNYDWYSPSQASRYSEDEFKRWIEDENLEITYFHKEEACYSGRFLIP